MNIGTIIQWGSDTIPDNWLLCDGSAVSRTTYADLFAVIGTNFGVGDGSTTFNLPDLRGRVGVGKSSDTEFDTLGETGGEKTHTLTTTEIPTMYAKSPTVASGGSIAVFKDEAVYGFNGSGAGSVIATIEGGGQAHNILQPYVVTNYIIKALVEDKVKISELESAASLDGTEVMPIVQSGTTKKITTDDLLGGIETDISNIQDNIDNILDGEVYSTSEVKTNKIWIDNKPIYRKVVDIGYLNSGNTTITHNISNINFIIDGKGFFYNENDNTWFPIPRAYPTNPSQYDVAVDIGTTNITITSGTAYNGTVFKGYIIMEYTKTTD